jgi:hypothetical protein
MITTIINFVFNLYKWIKLFLGYNKNSNPFEKKLLFIVKERVVYGTKTKAYGLYNSCNFVARRLRQDGYEANVVQVVDNNCIDKYVTQYKPTHCFIEALWVVPSKFEVLAKLHPKVKWIIRIHSMIPFLSSEGMAFEWINEYLALREKGIDISISCNNDKAYNDLVSIYGEKVISYTPNIYYPDEYSTSKQNFTIKKCQKTIHIGCFGALRVMKNHPQQALWAITFADEIGKKLYFHVNISEHEQREASPILRNLRAIFKNTKHELVEHLWYEHSDFLKLVKQMDLGMQVSFTETFNITAADFVYNNIPIVVSNEIEFVQSQFRVNATDTNQAIRALYRAYDGKKYNDQLNNFNLLKLHNHHATKAWLKYINS